MWPAIQIAILFRALSVSNVTNCLTCDGALATNCLSCPSSPTTTYLLNPNHSCVACNVDDYSISGSQCLDCNPSCLTCNGALATNCLSCPSSPTATYLLNSNHSCVDCNVDGYSILGSECFDCDSSCATCSGALPNQCLSCYTGTHLLSNDTGKYCQPRVPVTILKFELKESPQLYLLELDTPVDLEGYSEQIHLYLISNSSNLISANMSEMNFTLTKLDSNQSYHLNFISDTESTETRSLLLSFDQLIVSNSYVMTSSNLIASIFADSITAQAAQTVGTTSQVIAISARATTFLIYVQANGKTSQLMRILQIMARITFMKLINPRRQQFQTSLATTLFKKVIEMEESESGQAETSGHVS